MKVMKEDTFLLSVWSSIHKELSLRFFFTRKIMITATMMETKYGNRKKDYACSIPRFEYKLLGNLIERESFFSLREEPKKSEHVNAAMVVIQVHRQL